MRTFKTISSSLVISILASLMCALAVYAYMVWRNVNPETFLTDAATTAVSSPFIYSFKVDGVLQEAESADKSTSPYFWLNSGGSLILKDGYGATLHGALPIGSVWQKAYALGNSLDTGGGLYPQNLFRLITKSSWKNVEERIRFRVSAVNVTDTYNRDGYSGVLLLSRYRDSDNLYYAGVRMDGTAVIKKKMGGTYYTLASANVFGSPSSYNRLTNPNLIPEDRWMGLKTITTDRADGNTEIELWLDRANNGSWELIATAVDKPGVNGGATLKGEGHAGIRTDYLDVTFDDYALIER